MRPLEALYAMAPQNAENFAANRMIADTTAAQDD